jgi:glutamate 5-kinase
MKEKVIHMRAPGFRPALTRARKVVVKVGTRVLVDRYGRPNEKRFQELVTQIAEIARDGRKPILVTSGAVGAGIEALGWKSRPTNLPDLQMAASVGQSRLMAVYDKLFAKEGFKVGQVLLTHDDLKHRNRHLNARSTMTNLLRHGVIPVVNENDVVSVDEIKLGDNDILAALTSILIDADLLAILTTTNGLKKPSVSGASARVSYVERVTREVLSLAGGKGHDLSTGGMASKLQAASVAARAGVAVTIVDGRRKDILLRVLKGQDIGTLVGAADTFSRVGQNGKKRWLAFFHRAQGTLVIDDGAVRALEEKGNSLLPVGISKVDGHFGIGDLVNVRCRSGRLVARGLVEYNHEQLKKIHGHRTNEIERILGRKDYDEVIHRDNLVLLKSRHGDVE